jgi:hypothetical protein
VVYYCYEIKSLRFIGQVVFPKGHEEPKNAEHLFGDVVYLFKAQNDNDGTAWFEKAKEQPYLNREYIEAE